MTGEREGHTAPVRGRWTDTLVAAAVGGAAFVLYLRTLLPHLGGTEDTPKFQYLGAVLGSAHSPGYPVYVLVSHLFSYLPIGTLAYRMNLVSAIFGAMAVALAYLIARRLGAHRVVAIAIALACAAGRLFWANALIAEVYTLNAAIWAAAILKLADWTQSGRDRDLYWATGFVALGLGHHLTIVAIGPAALALLMLSGHRWFSLRRVMTCAAILLAGLTPYSYIWIRTLQGANYLESRASNLGELVAVMTARRYSDIMFSADLGTLLTTRLPEILNIFRLELGVWGALAAVAGAGVLARKRPAVAGLLILSILAMLALTANITGDAGGFLLPAYLMAWVLAAAAIEALRGVASHRLGSAAGATVAGVACLLPAAQVTGNFSTRDQSSRTFETRYFEALFRQLPADVAIAVEDYWPEHMIRYATVSGDFGRTLPAPRLVAPDPESIGRLIDRGVEVVASPSAIGPLRARGFAFEPFQLRGPALAEYVGALAPRLFVLGAAVGLSIPDQIVRALDGRISRWADQAPSAAFIGVTGGGSSRMADEQPGGLWLQPGEAIGSAGAPLPFAVTASVDRFGAMVSAEGREIARVDSGLALVVFDEGGNLIDVQRFVPADRFASQLGMRQWPLARVTRGGSCAAVGDALWHDVSGLAGRSLLDVRLDNRAAFDARALAYVVSGGPLRVEVSNFHPGCHDPAGACPPIERPETSIETWTIASSSDLEHVMAIAKADGLALAAGFAAVGDRVSRIRAVVNDQGQYALFALRLNGLARRVFVNIELDDPDSRRAAVCELVVPGLFAGNETTHFMDLRGDPLVSFGDGWHMAEVAGADLFRWTAAADARLLMPVDSSGPIRVTIEAHGLDLSEPQTLALFVNGAPAGENTPLGPGWSTYEWILPADALRPAANEVVLRVSRVERPAALGASGDTRPLGGAVRSIRFSRITR